MAPLRAILVLAFGCHVSGFHIPGNPSPLFKSFKVGRSSSALVSDRRATSKVLPTLLKSQNDPEEVGDRFKTWLSETTEWIQEPRNITLPWKEFALVAGGGFAGVIGAGILLFTPFNSLGTNIQHSLILFENVLTDLEENYVDEVDVPRLFQSALVGMLRTLDPYTEFEDMKQAADMQESVTGRYGGVGLVIASEKGPKSKPQNMGAAGAVGNGIMVVSAFEGYAFDAGLRPGDRLLSVGGVDVTGLSVEGVRDLLRGEPNTEVEVTYTRPSLKAPVTDKTREALLTRRLVRLHDVKLASLVGDREDGVGYVQLAGFTQGAGQELANAIKALDYDAPQGLKSLILDLRSNPGGLLESAVEIAAMLVPEGSNIVMAKGRGFGEVGYISKSAPILSPSTSLVVLTDGQTASAAEIVAGAVQDLDAGVVVGVGEGHTFGKGLVQSIMPLPYNSALKYTVAKYYTPSGRCIQSIDYKEGGVAMSGGAPSSTSTAPGAAGSSGPTGSLTYSATQVAEEDRKIFRTKAGRIVRDGGGVEADVSQPLDRASSLEVALQLQGAYFDFGDEWWSKHTYSPGKPVVTSQTMDEFQRFVLDGQADGKYNLGILYESQVTGLEASLSGTGLEEVATRDVSSLRGRILDGMKKEFVKRREPIGANLEMALLSRQEPDSVVLRAALETDKQFQLAHSLAMDKPRYHKLLTPKPAEMLASEEDNGYVRLAVALNKNSEKNSKLNAVPGEKRVSVGEKSPLKDVVFGGKQVTNRFFC